MKIRALFNTFVNGIFMFGVVLIYLWIFGICFSFYLFFSSLSSFVLLLFAFDLKNIINLSCFMFFNDIKLFSLIYFLLWRCICFNFGLLLKQNKTYPKINQNKVCFGLLIQYFLLKMALFMENVFKNKENKHNFPIKIQFYRIFQVKSYTKTKIKQIYLFCFILVASVLFCFIS